MTKMDTLVFCLWAYLLLLFASCAYAEPVTEPEVAFSTPFICETARGTETRCLAEAFKPGLSAVLLGGGGICGAITAEAFTYEHHTADFEATRLSGTGKCFAVQKNEHWFTDFQMALVGVEPAMVRQVSAEADRSPVPKEIEREAKKLAAAYLQERQKISNWAGIGIGISDDYRVLRTDDVKLIIFNLLTNGQPSEPGPSVIVKQGKVFLLEGSCTYGAPLFFVVNDKLHLTYTATVACCGCGDTNFFVYDLSGETPKKVYHNWKFSD